LSIKWPFEKAFSSHRSRLLRTGRDCAESTPRSLGSGSAIPLQDRVSFCRLFLCSSRACLGKCSAFSIKWHRKKMFAHRRRAWQRTAACSRVIRSHAEPPAATNLAAPAGYRTSVVCTHA
jgi:hypothetical protein